MKAMYHYIDHKKGITKDTSILIVLFCYLLFCRLAICFFHICFMCLSPDDKENDPYPQSRIYFRSQILLKGKELPVPKEVDIFDLSNVPSIEYLYKYVEVIGGISIPPSIFIIRFNGILEIQEFELKILMKVIERLQKSSIIVILSDVKGIVRNQFNRYKIEQKVGNENIFYQITDALILTKRLKAGKPV